MEFLQAVGGDSALLWRGQLLSTDENDEI